jgi:hypothetical protein
MSRPRFRLSVSTSGRADDPSDQPAGPRTAASVDSFTPARVCRPATRFSTLQFPRSTPMIGRDGCLRPPPADGNDKMNRKLEIMCVDDEEDILEIASMALEMLGDDKV